MLFVLLLQTSCHSLISDPIKVTYAANLMASCSPVPDVQVGDDIVDSYVLLRADRNEICARHDALVKSVQGK